MANAPWAAGGSPDEATLRELLRDHTHREIADKYKVTRQTVGYWVKRHGLAGAAQPAKSHKDILPWDIKGEDHHDSIARALRWYNTGRQGEALTPPQQREVDRLMAFVEKNDYVIDYSRELGFHFRKRNPKLDKPDDVIRRPAA